MSVSILSLSSDTPEDGIRWLEATMCLLGIEIRTFRRAVRQLTTFLRANSEPAFQCCFLLWPSVLGSNLLLGMGGVSLMYHVTLYHHHPHRP